MADDVSRFYAPDPRRSWWYGAAFRFLPPEFTYDRDVWRNAVIGHGMMQDFLALLRARLGRKLSQDGFQERLDSQGHWFPLVPTLTALDMREPPHGLFPLPQPRSASIAAPNDWILGLNLDVAHERSPPTVFIPFGLIASRLAPESARPMAQLLALWLAYRVLPVCAQYGGPTTWVELDRMLNPAHPVQS